MAKKRKDKKEKKKNPLDITVKLPKPMDFDEAMERLIRVNPLDANEHTENTDENEKPHSPE